MSTPRRRRCRACERPFEPGRAAELCDPCARSVRRLEWQTPLMLRSLIQSCRITAARAEIALRRQA